ncbi:uncharacterized protein PG986_000854 [Apiospora aurea]|uniref:cGMP-dependent protein kinase interacting domain-containing protein n=1 Tax=Apiospora aurea TaxID=335848 RepID=A0ABR1QV59_9PEZI
MPDINSIPASPYATPRRTSTTQPQQAASLASSASQAQQQHTGAPASTSPALNILPSNQQTYHQRTSSTSLPSPPLPAPSSNPAALPMAMPPPPAPATARQDPAETGPGPIRHPRPLTAAELHQQLEQEQELLVNRLTRDLTILRAQQNSSVVSNTSSTSASASVDQTPTSFVDTHLMSGPGFPLPTTSSDRRHQRTSSSTSTRSLSHAAAAGSVTGPLSAVHSTGGGASALEAARNPNRSSAMSMSRQNSTTSHRSASRNHSPNPFSRHDSDYVGSFTSASGGYFPRRQISTHGSVAATPGSELSPGLMPATLRYEETAHYRQELETAKRENENLKRRIKELEKVVRERRASDASVGGRVRSESVSTTTSGVGGATGVGGGGTGIAGGRGRAPGGAGMERAFSSMSVAGSVGVGVPEEELRVGESAASQGLGQEGK